MYYRFLSLLIVSCFIFIGTVFSNTIEQDVVFPEFPALRHNINFWKNISLPPETKFYKENISELVSLYGVPIETQFQYSN